MNQNLQQALAPNPSLDEAKRHLARAGYNLLNSVLSALRPIEVVGNFEKETSLGFVGAAWDTLKQPWTIVTGPINLVCNLVTDFPGTVNGIVSAIGDNPGRFLGQTLWGMLLGKGIAGASRLVGGRLPVTPLHAQTTLNTIRTTGRPPVGYRGAGAWANDGRAGGQVLPRTTSNGTPITYAEYDVNPFARGVNRGPQRLVIGSNGRAYYTADHYATFTEVP